MERLFSGTSKICFFLDAIYWDGWTFTSLLVNLTNLHTIEHISNRNAILSYFRHYLGYLQASLFSIKDADAKSACARSIYIRNACSRNICTKGICTRDVYAKDACIRDICMRVTYIEHIFAVGACARKVYIKSAYIKSIYVRDTFIRGVGTIYCLRIHLQSFQILEVEQYDTGLETKVEVG